MCYSTVYILDFFSFFFFCLVGCGMSVLRFLTKYLNREKLDISAARSNSGELKLMNGTSPYGHPVNTATSVLRPLYSDLDKSTISQFLFRESL